jgi:hypothetical protein
MRLVETCCAAALAIATFTGSASAQTPPAAPQAVARTAPAAPVARARTLTRFSATSVQLRDVAAFVRVIPENRTDVAVGFVNEGVLGAPEYRVSRRRLIIDGKLRRQIRNCRVSGADGFEVETSRRGRLSGSQLPTIELRVPQNAIVSASGAVRMNVAPAQNATIGLGGCGDADIVRVEDEVTVSVSGSQDVRLYNDHARGRGRHYRWRCARGAHLVGSRRWRFRRRTHRWPDDDRHSGRGRCRYPRWARHQSQRRHLWRRRRYSQRLSAIIGCRYSRWRRRSCSPRRGRS